MREQVVSLGMANEKSSSGGVGLMELLFVAFLVLKLAKVGAVADWSWWWVTAPLWGPIAFFIACYLFIVFIRAIS